MTLTRLRRIAISFIFICAVITALTYVPSEFLVHSSALANSPPVAVDDSYTVHGTRQMLPLQNDYDPDGDSISSHGLVSPPHHGGVLSYSQGVFAYTANYGYVGSDSFTYSVCDSYSACSTGRLTSRL